MVELKLTNLYNTLMGTTFCTCRHVICCCSFTNVMLLFCHFQYHYESRVAMRLILATVKTRYKVLYQNTIYVISFSNISTKPSFKQITMVELKLTNLYNTPRETTLCM